MASFAPFPLYVIIVNLAVYRGSGIIFTWRQELLISSKFDEILAHTSLKLKDNENYLMANVRFLKSQL